MRDIERYLDRVVDADREDPQHQQDLSNSSSVIDLAPPTHLYDNQDDAGGSNPLRGMLRRWYVILLVFVIVVVVGIPTVWLVMEPGYIMRGYLQFSTAQEDVLTGDIDRMANTNVLQTEAIKALGPMVLERVADDLADIGDLDFFNKNYDVVSRVLNKVGITNRQLQTPTDILRDAIACNVISSAPIRDTDLVAVSMKSMDKREAKVVVDAILENYAAISMSGDAQATQEKLSLLHDEREALLKNMELSRERIRQLAIEFDGVSLTVEQEMAARRSTSIFERLNALQARRLNLEIQKDLLEKHYDANDVPQDQILARKEYLNADDMIQELNGSILSMQQEMIVAKQHYSAGNPVLTEKQNLLDAFQEKLEQRTKEVEQEYEAIVDEQKTDLQARRLNAVTTELKRLTEEEFQLTKILNERDLEKKRVGTASYEIQDLQFQLSLDKEMHDAVTRRIKQVEIERKRRPWIQIHSRAEEVGYEDKRPKMSAATVFVGLLLGCVLAFFLGKRDKRLWSPDEVYRHVRSPLLGTITQADLHKTAGLADTLIADFQTVRTNLSLVSNGGIPSRLAVVSPGTQDGKTTFCINLATSLASSGKRVLLIDGDLRRPSVMHAMGINKHAHRSHKVVAEAGFDYMILTMPSSGLDVLIPEVRCMADPFELIASPILAERLNDMGTRYDHIIIDTPPVLAFPDGILLSKIAEAAVMISFSGRTTGPDLEEAVYRLERANVKVVGNVMNNVAVDYGYHKYGYGYYSASSHREDKEEKKTRKKDIPILATGD